MTSNTPVLHGTGLRTCEYSVGDTQQAAVPTARGGTGPRYLSSGVQAPTLRRVGCGPPLET